MSFKTTGDKKEEPMSKTKENSTHLKTRLPHEEGASEGIKLLQIGTNDGDDPVFTFIEENASDIDSCMLVDSNPWALEKAREKYKDFSFCDFKFTAVIPIEIGGKQISFHVPNNDRDSPFSSIDPDFTAAHAQVGELFQYEVDAISLEKLMREVPDITHLIIDTEGYDMLNLFSIDLLRYPSLKQVCFEHLHADGMLTQGNRLRSLIGYFNSCGYYVLYDNGSDCNLIAEKQPPEKPEKPEESDE